jgi:branched-chain amino acid transport system ATP-binding protein
MMASPALELRGLSVAHGRVTVVRDVDLVVPGSGVVCLLGRNGAGKTTLLKSVMGLLPRSGAVRIAGEDSAGWSGSRVNAAGVAWVPQEAGVFPGITVAEHLHIAARFDRDRLDEEVLDLFPVLGQRSNQHADTLSGGERKMLGMALALLSRPRLILLDEPTEGVAPVIVDELVELIQGLSERCALLLVEQNLDTALATADHCYVLEQGSIVESGDPEVLHRDGVLESRLAV